MGRLDRVHETRRKVAGWSLGAVGQRRGVGRSRPFKIVRGEKEAVLESLLLRPVAIARLVLSTWSIAMIRGRCYMDRIALSEWCRTLTAEDFFEC